MGPDADANTAASIKDYYGWLGKYVGMMTDAVANTPERAQQYVTEFADAGCDELFLFPASKDPDQVDLLADAVKPGG